jgi:protocadherin Fat 1/2/3
VIAHDRDQGSNGEVRYAFGSDIGDVANVFAVDAYTGWITTLVQLDKEQQAEFVFQVVATDNGSPKHFARTSVYIKLKDYNDNPPVFTNRHYLAAGECPLWNFQKTDRNSESLVLRVLY